MEGRRLVELVMESTKFEDAAVLLRDNAGWHYGRDQNQRQYAYSPGTAWTDDGTIARADSLPQLRRLMATCRIPNYVSPVLVDDTFVMCDEWDAHCTMFTQSDTSNDDTSDDESHGFAEDAVNTPAPRIRKLSDIGNHHTRSAGKKMSQSSTSDGGSSYSDSGSEERSPSPKRRKRRHARAPMRT